MDINATSAVFGLHGYSIGHAVELGLLILLFPLFYITPSTVRSLWHHYIMYNVSSGESCLPIPPGSFGYPLIGETIEFIRKGISTFYQERYTRYGNVYKTHILGKPTVRVIGADNIKKLLTGESANIIPFWPTSVQRFLGKKNFLHATGYDYKVRKRLIVHTFTHNALVSCIPSIHTEVKRVLGNWIERKEVLAVDECRKLTLLMNWTIVMGLDSSYLVKTDMVDDFLDMMSSLLTVPIEIPGSTFYKAMKTRERFIDRLTTIIKNCSDQEQHMPWGLVHAREHCGLTFSDEELAEIAFGLIATGEETLASAMSSLIFYLASHGDVLSRIREETESLQIGDETGELSMNDLNNLNYVHDVIREVLRICPPSGAGFRKTIKTIEIGGYQIPKGWTVLYSIRETQMTSPIFTDPEKFNPDRWNPNTCTFSKTDQHYNYLPFSVGTRACAGKEYANLALKTFLIELSNHCDWILQNQNSEIKYIPSAFAVDSLPIAVKKHCIG